MRDNPHGSLSESLQENPVFPDGTIWIIWFIFCFFGILFFGILLFGLFVFLFFLEFGLFGFWDIAAIRHPGDERFPF